ncbi:Signal recognition particle 19 kDa protein [Trichoplax sp. H2]|uniref:Signal recognition particle 19 kDa protein n=1 Tax=Trichoplax adhaerens TaxID=10228 RepID=B3RS35_TRIAD|nr:hypothetical protein TRIADDRAFT_22815 [Trichoplax adhaerens]EDV26448.1 hypothetical protein TRIADDRAFT_22815 [Trichoplax adhaerens]RDD40679.1 Signal recognition particle 19 kDa protein [Trichoplax sp. H2]|eukprot:XP_002110444.1 hypothetical protein TRIADDRAFT_22815 [Trichoplax adhaerens]
MSAYLPKDPSAPQRWICVYPVYIDKNKKIPEGRRVCKEKACENPTAEEIRDICRSQGFDAEIERKQYPRNSYFDNPSKGRVRIRMFNNDQTLANPKFKTRKQLLVFIGEMIPKLKSRQAPKGAEGGASGADAGGNVGGSTSKKKKNKKGKR